MCLRAIGGGTGRRCPWPRLGTDAGARPQRTREPLEHQPRFVGRVLRPILPILAQGGADACASVVVNDPRLARGRRRAAQSILLGGIQPVGRLALTGARGSPPPLRPAPARTAYRCASPLNHRTLA